MNTGNKLKITAVYFNRSIFKEKKIDPVRLYQLNKCLLNILASRNYLETFWEKRGRERGERETD